MPPRASSNDPNVIAFRVVQESTRDPSEPALVAPPLTKSDLARALGALGASKGGKARAAKLSTAKKKAIAMAGAKARWDAHRAAGSKKRGVRKPK